MSKLKIKFSNSLDNNFQRELRAKVSEYFKKAGVSRHANLRMIIKTITLLTGYFAPYLIMLTVSMPGWAYILLTLLMSFSLAGIGMSIMHDANHGAYSSSKRLNMLLGYTMNLIGGNRFNWMIQHNVKHHTYTNIYGADEDLHTGGVIRFSRHARHFWFHRFQHFYSWVLYTLGTFTWLTTKDFKQLTDLYKQGVIDREVLIRELGILVVWKALYFTYMLVIPIMLINLPVIYIIMGFVGMHLLAGFITGLTFQLAHVVELTAQGTSEHKNIRDSWVAHQVKTTANFSRSNWFLNWYLGGLNFQVEHHLFPDVCHVHYQKLADIVKETVTKKGLPYHEHASLLDAIRSHYRMLKSLSVKQNTTSHAVAGPCGVRNKNE